jgi:hypothetical protein
MRRPRRFGTLPAFHLQAPFQDAPGGGDDPRDNWKEKRLRSLSKNEVVCFDFQVGSAFG